MGHLPDALDHLVELDLTPPPPAVSSSLDAASVVEAWQKRLYHDFSQRRT